MRIQSGSTWQSREGFHFPVKLWSLQLASRLFPFARRETIRLSLSKSFPRFAAFFTSLKNWRVCETFFIAAMSQTSHPDWQKSQFPLAFCFSPESRLCNCLGFPKGREVHCQGKFGDRRFVLPQSGSIRFG